MRPAGSGCWTIAAGGALPCRSWDGEFVVYNPISGNTHILDLVSGEILTALFPGPCSTAALATHLAGFLDIPDDDGVSLTVARVLDVLDELGLVQPATGC